MCHNKLPPNYEMINIYLQYDLCKTYRHNSDKNFDTSLYIEYG